MNLDNLGASIARLPVDNTMGFDRVRYARAVLIMIVIACDLAGMYAMAFSITVSGRHAAELIIVGAATLALQSLAVAVAARLVAMDAALGFHWPALAGVAREPPAHDEGPVYLVDIFAGLLIVAVAIALSLQWRRSPRRLA